MPADSRSSPPSDETLSSGTRIQDLIVEQWVRSVPDGHHYRVVHAGTGRGATLHEYLPRAWARRHADGVRALPGHGQDFHAGVRRFLMKARQLRTLEHPALPVLLDAWTSHGTAFALMSPLPAQTLAEVVAAHGGRLPLAQAWPWICACFELAEWLHRQGKIYGAWDPHAIWVQEDQRLLMAAPEVDGGARPASAWVALEQSAQAPSGTKCGPWTDVFGIAAMAAFMLTGQTPTAARRLPLAAWMPAAPQATPRAGRRPPVEPPPRALLAAIRVSLLPNPRQRPQDIAQLKAMMGLGPQLPVLQEQARLGEPMGGDSTLDGDTVPMHELPDGPFLPPEGTTAPVAAQHAGVALPRTQTAPMPLDADLPPDSSARPSPPARRRRSPSAIALAGLLVVVVGVTWLAWRSERTADVVAHDASPAAAPQRALDQLVQGRRRRQGLCRRSRRARRRLLPMRGQ